MQSILDSNAKRLREVQFVPWLCAGVAHHGVGGGGPEHRKPVLRLIVVDGMAAGNEGARLRYRIGSALQDGRCHIGSQGRIEGEQIQRNMGLRSHGKHIGKRICRCDATEFVGVVDHGGEEIHREHAYGVVAQLP